MYLNKCRIKTTKRNQAANSITPRRNSRRKNQPRTHAPDPSATVNSGGHYVSRYVTRDLLSVRLYQFFGTLCVVCIRGLSICLTITEYTVVTEYKLAHFQATVVSIVDLSLETASFSWSCLNMPKYSIFDWNWCIIDRIQDN